ncbi:MAG: T9SS type A sorting domain-containing protein [Bacteroidia bacterium]|nr:T9SS type A sorting domain-containing protein [Bacteroidia bacterium]
MKNFFILFLSASTMLVNAQITILNTNLPNNGDTLRYSIVNLNSLGNYTVTGTNYIWHFDSLTVIRQGVRSFTNNTPYILFFGPTRFGEKIADTLLSQNIPGFGNITITDFYQFYRNTPTIFDIEGLGLKINNIPMPSFYTDKDELYFLPLNYGDKDSSTFKFSTLTNTAIPITYKKSGYRITQADGWGSITTPYGTFNCLRVITTQYSKDTIIFNSTFGQIPIGFNNYQRSYQWISTSEKIPILEISGTINNAGNFTPNLARFRDNYRVLKINEYNKPLTNLKVFPNPSLGTFKIENIFTTNNIHLSIFNSTGQNVMNTTEYTGFSDEIEIDVSHLPNGNYTGVIKDNSNQYWFHFNIVK